VYVPKPYSPAKIVEIIQQMTAQADTRNCRTPADRLADLLRDHRKMA
jgi:hypothetical protein